MEREEQWRDLSKMENAIFNRIVYQKNSQLKQEIRPRDEKGKQG